MIAATPVVAGFVAAFAAFPCQDERPPMDALSAALLHPHEVEVVDEAFAALAPEPVRIESPRGLALRGLWFESPASDQTIVVCMGNTGNASWMLPFAAILHGGGFDVLLFDWQGFGGSEGTGSLLALPGDALAAWRYVTEVRGRTKEQVGLLGISLGSVLALQLAAQVDPRACAVEDLFFPDEQVDRQVGRPDSAALRLTLAAAKTLLLPQVDPRVNAQRYRGPLFLLHGERDWLLTPMATLALAAQRPERTRTWILAETGHSPDSLQIDEGEYAAQLVAFFREAFAGELPVEPRARLESPPPANAIAPLPLLADGEKKESSAVEGAAAPAVYPIRVTVTSARAAPIQVALVRRRDGQEELQGAYERRYLPAGTTTFEVELPFLPTHAVATEMRHVRDRGDGTFEPELTPLSRSLRDWKELLIEWGGSAECATLTLKTATAQGMSESSCDLRWTRHWEWLQRRLPDFEEVDPRVRPRYAELLALLALDLETTQRIAWGADPEAILDRMVTFLPPDPRHFVTLGNAAIVVGFGGGLIERSLLLLWHRRLRAGDRLGAQQVWNEFLKYQPEALPATGPVEPPR